MIERLRKRKIMKLFPRRKKGRRRNTKARKRFKKLMLENVTNVISKRG